MSSTYIASNGCTTVEKAETSPTTCRWLFCLAGPADPDSTMSGELKGELGRSGRSAVSGCCKNGIELPVCAS